MVTADAQQGDRMSAGSARSPPADDLQPHQAAGIGDGAERQVWDILTDDCNLSAAAGTGIGVMDLEGEAGFLGRSAGALYVWDEDLPGIKEVSHFSARSRLSLFLYAGPSSSKQRASLSYFPFDDTNDDRLPRLQESWPSQAEAERILDAYCERHQACATDDTVTRV